MFKKKDVIPTTRGQFAAALLKEISVSAISTTLAIIAAVLIAWKLYQ